MTSQRSFPRFFPKWRDWKEYLTSSKMKCARSLHHQQNTRPWPLTRHVTSWRWRNPRCITILSATTFLPPNEERTTFFSKTSLLAGWSLVVNLPSHYRRKKWTLKSCHPLNANRAGSEIDEPMVLARSSFSWLTNAMWQSSGGSVMYVREKASLFRHTFSFSVHIPRSLWSNDIQMSPQQTLLCQSGCVTAVPMTTSFPTQS